MPKPSTKKQMIDQAEKEFAALEKTIAGLPAPENRPASTPEIWAAEDFIAHLWEWQNMFFGWYESGCRGEIPAVPAPGYKWNQLLALNLEIYRKYRGRPLKDLLAGLRTSHTRMLELVNKLSDEELFTPGFYAWQNRNTLCANLVSAGSSHYLWARKEIQKSMKTY